MEVIEEVPTTKKIVRRYCDDCGKELHWVLRCSNTECEFCKKQLCADCIAHERPTGGDYRIVYCKTCSDIYRKHKPEIDKANRVAYATYNAMRDECISVAKQKGGRIDRR